MKPPYSQLKDIPDHEYVGYIWEANEKQPHVFTENQKITRNYDSYIVEGWLYCESEKLSIHIKHTGKQQIYEYQLDQLSKGNEWEEVSYLPHRLGDKVERVKFQQLWMPEEDEHCCNMPVLKMKALIFTGFKKY